MNLNQITHGGIFDLTEMAVIKVKLLRSLEIVIKKVLNNFMDWY